MMRDGTFKGRQFAADIILWAVRWYLMFPISYRDLEMMLADRGVEVDHTTMFRWILAYAEDFEKRLRPHLHPTNGSWRVEEPYVKVKGLWVYLYRAVYSRSRSIHAPSRWTGIRPIPGAAGEMKSDGELWRFSQLRQIKYLNNIVEQDHRR